MDTQQQPNPDGYTKLNDITDKTTPNVQFLFEQKDSDESNARHRTSRSGNEVPTSGSTAQNSRSTSSQPQKKELSSIFAFFYGALLVVFLVFHGFFLIGMTGKGFDNFDFFVVIWLEVQCIIAFLGLCNKDVGKIGKAFTMMKIFFALLIISTLGRLFDALAIQQKYETTKENPIAVALMSGIMGLFGFTLLIFLPTRKVKNTWKSMIQEEEIRKEQAQDIDPIEKLDSLKFTIYKYMLLLSVCWELKSMVPAIYEDFSDLPKCWEDMMAETNFLVAQLYIYSLFPVSLISTFLAFEGLRRKNLEKILTSIKLMKVHLVVQFIFSCLTTIMRYFEGSLTRDYQNTSNAIDIKHDWVILLYFLSVEVFNALVCSAWVYFTSQIRDILKAHQKARHTL